MFSEDDTSIESNKKFTRSCKTNIRKEMPFLCHVSENEINLNSNGLGHKRKGRKGGKGKWLEYHG